jgi:hypothetical protein
MPAPGETGRKRRRRTLEQQNIGHRNRSRLAEADHDLSAKG